MFLKLHIIRNCIAYANEVNIINEDSLTGYVRIFGIGMELVETHNYPSCKLLVAV